VDQAIQFGSKQEDGGFTGVVATIPCGRGLSRDLVWRSPPTPVLQKAAISTSRKVSRAGRTRRHMPAPVVYAPGSCADPGLPRGSTPRWDGEDGWWHERQVNQPPAAPWSRSHLASASYVATPGYPAGGIIRCSCCRPSWFPLHPLSVLLISILCGAHPLVLLRVSKGRLLPAVGAIPRVPDLTFKTLPAHLTRRWFERCNSKQWRRCSTAVLGCIPAAIPLVVASLPLCNKGHTSGVEFMRFTKFG
jgi:hypothetical protein